MSNGSRTNFCYLINEVICIPKPVDRKIILLSVITLPHIPLLSIDNFNQYNLSVISNHFYKIEYNIDLKVIINATMLVDDLLNVPVFVMSLV